MWPKLNFKMEISINFLKNDLKKSVLHTKLYPKNTNKFIRHKIEENSLHNITSLIVDKIIAFRFLALRIAAHFASKLIEKKNKNNNQTQKRIEHSSMNFMELEILNRQSFYVNYFDGNTFIRT